MRASLCAAVLAVVLVSTGCGQSASPTSPTSGVPSGLSASPGSGSPTSGAFASVSGAAASGVPLKGRLEGTFLADDSNFPFVSVEVDARGTATHLGRFTLEFDHVVDFRDFTVVGPATAIFTAANGDRVTTSAVPEAVTPQDTPGAFLIEETHTITGGTGRFAGATGSFVIERLTTPPNPRVGTTSGSLEGTISFQ